MKNSELIKYMGAFMVVDNVKECIDAIDCTQEDIKKFSEMNLTGLTDQYLHDLLTDYSDDDPEGIGEQVEEAQRVAKEFLKTHSGPLS